MIAALLWIIALAGDATCHLTRQGLLVSSEDLRNAVKLDAIVKHLTEWQWEGHGYPEHEKIRVAGTLGHNRTQRYIVDALESTEYYDVVEQPFEFTLMNRDVLPELVVNHEPIRPKTIFSEPESTFQGLSLVFAAPDECNGSTNAGRAGAVGLVVYGKDGIEPDSSGNTSPGGLEKGHVIPTLGISNAQALPLLQSLSKGESFTVDFTTGPKHQIFHSTNVIATTKQGDGDNVVFLGAHSDTVPQSLGMNDNGSGSATLLEVALQLSKFSVKNKVRFAWWTAEELGLRGSKHYVEHLDQDELMKIRLYLNHDMLASGNGILSALDGDGDTFNNPGPPGSAEIEHMYQDYFASVGEILLAGKVDGSSDYKPFLDALVPCGGLFTGAGEVLTPWQSHLFHDDNGKVGEPHDLYYHGEGDTIVNMSLDLLETNAEAVAHSVGKYARSLSGFPERKRPEKSDSSKEEAKG